MHYNRSLFRRSEEAAAGFSTRAFFTPLSPRRLPSLIGWRASEIARAPNLGQCLDMLRRPRKGPELGLGLSKMEAEVSASKYRNSQRIAMY